MTVTCASVRESHLRAKDLQGVVKALKSITYDQLSGGLLGEVVDWSKEAKLVEKSE
jgi:hypothetical protein